jgi:hypothetical protein
MHPTRTRRGLFTRRAVFGLVIAALAIAWSGATPAQAAPQKAPAKKAVSTSDPFSAGPSNGTRAPAKKDASTPDPFSAEPGSGGQHPAKKAVSAYEGSTTIAAGAPKGGRTYASSTTIAGGIGAFPATLDQALNMALETSPKVMAAKARVTLAEAELSSAQMDVARKIVQLWTERQTRQLFYEEKLEANRKTPGTFPAPFLIEAGAAVTQVEMELRCLIGQASSTAPRSVRLSATLNIGSNISVASERPAKPLQLPHGPMVEAVRKALLSPTEIVFVESPISEVMDYLKERHKIEILIDAKALAEAGMTKEKLITCDLKPASLAAALQAWDDLMPELKIVVRDYGLLVTTPERAREQGYFAAVAFARLGAGRGSVFETRQIRGPNGELQTITEERTVEPAPPQLEMEVAPATRGSNPVYPVRPAPALKPIPSDEEKPTFRPSR